MARTAYLVSVLVASVFAASAQNLAETALAAATGSVAGVAGKPISDGLSKIFGSVHAQTKSAASTSERNDASAARETEPTKPGVNAPALGSAPATSGSAPARRWTGLGRMHYAALPPDSAPKPTVQTAPPPTPQPTLEQIASVRNGTERADVLTRLGSPAARLSIPEGGQMVEVYQYLDGAGNLGSVRLRDGRVSEVRVDNQAN